MGLRFRQQGKNGESRLLYGIRKSAFRDDAPDVRHRPVVVFVAVAGMAVFMGQHVNPHAVDAGLRGTAAFQLPLPMNVQFGQFPFQNIPVRAQVDQGGQIHVSADACAAIIDQDSHDKVV